MYGHACSTVPIAIRLSQELWEHCTDLGNGDEICCNLRRRHAEVLIELQFLVILANGTEHLRTCSDWPCKQGFNRIGSLLQ
jgi:hypothetical protein